MGNTPRKHILSGLRTQPCPFGLDLYNSTSAQAARPKVSALALLMLGILTNDANTAFSFKDLAFIADRLYRRSYLHVNPPFIMLDLQ